MLLKVILTRYLVELFDILSELQIVCLSNIFHGVIDPLLLGANYGIPQSKAIIIVTIFHSNTLRNFGCKFYVWIKV